MSTHYLSKFPFSCWPWSQCDSKSDQVACETEKQEQHQKQEDQVCIPWSGKTKISDQKAVRLVLTEFAEGPITIEGRFFQGHTFTPLGSIGVGTFDTPLFNTENRLVGRLVGFYIVFVATGSVPAIAVGTWNFELFPRRTAQDDDKTWECKRHVRHWISASTGFNNSPVVPSTEIPNVILNGTGDFLGVNGEVSNKVVAPGEQGYDPLIPKVRWTLTLRK